MDVEKEPLSAVDFLKNRCRMCKTISDCHECPGFDSEDDNQCVIYSDDFLDECPEKAAKIVENWAKKHPLETHKSEFLKVFPDTKESLFWSLCPKALDANWECHAKQDCAKCRCLFWNEEVK